MYKLMVRKTFSAAHFLPDYDGKCKNLHGHNWTVEIFFTSQLLCNGLAIDFKELKEKLGEILKEFDHTNLNDHEWFKECPPSCENIAQYIYWKLSEKLDDEWRFIIINDAWTAKKFNNSIHVLFNSVRVWESENAYAEYSEY